MYTSYVLGVAPFWLFNISVALLPIKKNKKKNKTSVSYNVFSLIISILNVAGKKCKDF